MVCEIAAPADPGILEVVLLGFGTVFVGIIIIIIACRLFGLVDSAIFRRKKKAEAPPEEIRPDPELAAAIGAAIAEENGVDVKNIRIVSVKKV